MPTLRETRTQLGWPAQAPLGGLGGFGPDVFISEPEKRLRVASKLKRILIVDPNVRSSRFLGSLLKSGLQARVFTSAFFDAGFALARSANPHLILVEHTSVGLDGYALTRKIRRSDLPSRKAPVIMVTAEATASAIAMARDAGIHEFLRKPYTSGELQRRLEAVSLLHRDWIEGIAYVGPDRRRFNSAAYAGPRRRAEDGIKQAGAGADEERLLQALKIVRSVEFAASADLPQIKRAVAAQATAIESNPTAPAALVRKIVDLAHWCQGVEVFDPQARADFLDQVNAMVGFLPRGT